MQQTIGLKTGMVKCVATKKETVLNACLVMPKEQVCLVMNFRD